MSLEPLSAIFDAYRHVELPIPIRFATSDEDTWLGDVVHEQVWLDGALLLDGDTTGNRNGLLSDEFGRPAATEIIVDAPALCRSPSGSVGMHRLTVTATDCGGNSTSVEVEFEVVLALAGGGFRVEPESFSLTNGKATAFLAPLAMPDGCGGPSITTGDFDPDSLQWISLRTRLASLAWVVSGNARRLVLKTERAAFGADPGIAFALTGDLITGGRFVAFDDVRKSR